MGLQGLKYNNIDIFGKNFVGHLLKNYKISNEDILTEISSMRAFG